MKPHKWHKEIKAWADGAEIECFLSDSDGWCDVTELPCFYNDRQYRIKPQLKKPKHLYVWMPYDDELEVALMTTKPTGILDDGVYKYVGKIKLENDSEN